MIYDGKNGGTVELLDNALVIRRYGVLSALNQGLKGDKRIPYSSILSVQFKNPGITTGYIQFGVAGGIEGGGGVFNATQDENTVLFVSSQLAQFEQLRDEVERRAHAARTPSTHITATGVADELAKLADLRDRGVLTPEEFEDQKRQILANRAPTADATKVSSSVKPAPSAQSAHRTQMVVNTIEPQKMGAGKKLGLGCLVVLVLLVILGAIGGNSAADKKAEEVTSTRPLVDSAGSNAEIAEPVEADPQNWSYSQSEDKVRGGTTYSASTRSTNSISQSFPYDSDTTMEMTVRKSPQWGTDVIFTVSSGQMMCPSYEGCKGTVRFDSGPPQRVSFLGPEDNSSDTIFVEGAKSFIAKLKRAKKVTLEKTLYEAGNPQFEFDVSGLDWDH